MKNLIAAISIMATGAALASAVTSDTTFGVLKVTSTNLQTVISVPWEAVGSGDVKVKDFVKTSNLIPGTKPESTELMDGDKLYLYSVDDETGEGSYKGWFLNSTNVWEGLADPDDPITTGTDNDSIKRGSALILVRPRLPVNAETNIYLYGQYTTLNPSFNIVRRSDKVVNSLFAPINDGSTPIYVNKQTESGRKYLAWTNPSTGDKIKLQLPNGKAATFVYDEARFKDDNTKGWELNINGTKYHELAQILPGMGAWYRAVEGSGAPSYTVTTAP